MCGRYTLHHNAEELAERFAVEEVGAELAPRYNIAPSQLVPVIRLHPQTGARELVECKWGLVPYWAKDPAVGNKLVNARAETLTEKPSFKYALEKRRCLIPADGFYEWDKSSKPSQPMHIRRRDSALFAFAGLWEVCRLLTGETIVSCTIITVAPNELMASIHSRMPAMLEPAAEAAWLEATAKPAAVLPLLQPYSAAAMEAWPVARAVNSPAQDGAALIERTN